MTRSLSLPGPATPTDRSAANGRWYGLAAAWLLALAAGFAFMLDFEMRPGASAQADRWWPARTRLEQAREGTTAVMFLHPECPCSSASLVELDHLLQHNTRPTKIYLVLVGGDASAGLETSRNAIAAAKIPGAMLWIDNQGEEARRFGSQTSGDLLVFDAAGRLQFDGGITASRGHVGESAASAAARAAMQGDNSATSHMPVFGCPLF